MASVGVRELRQRASEVLRRVEAGETVEVTDRGRPVALLTPYPSPEGLDGLRAIGETITPRQALDTLPDPIELGPDSERPSEVLARLRRDEH